MKTGLAPKHFSKLVNSHILWFEVSNQYIVISDSLFEIIDVYSTSNTQDDFIEQLQNDFKIPFLQAEAYYNDITELLISSSSNPEPEVQHHKSPLIPEHGLEEIYAFGGTTFKISFGCEQIKALIHPQWAHASAHQTESISCNFIMFREDGFLHLFKDYLYVGRYPVADYHFLQGQFALQLINTLYNKKESDWIATFHASTVCNDNEAIMIIGDSGNGKSTLSAILMAHGFDVLADDFTPLLAEDREIYRFPSGISAKEGAFKMLKNLFPDFEDFPTYTSTSKNVNIKYIPPIKTWGTAKSHFPCKKIVFVKYDADAPSVMTEISIEKLLETLIPESWLSPVASNAQLFLEWLKDLTCYELTYSDNATVVSKFSKLFDV